METEIQFLLRLVMEVKLPPSAKKACLERIGEVEKNLSSTVQQPHNGNYNAQPRQQPGNNTFPVATANQQSPSTLALMAKHGILPPASVVPAEAPQQLEQVLQQQPAEAPVINPVAITQALASRQALIDSALSDPEGKRSKRTSGLKVGMR